MLHPLHLDPDLPAWVVAASWPVLMVHIAAGLIALMSGAAALAAPKGERLHRGAGAVFFVAMLVMLSLGGAIAAVGPNWPTAIGAVFGVYLVATAWMAARRPEGRVGRFESVAMAVALIVGATELTLGVLGATSASGHPGRLPWQPAIILAVVAATAVFADLRVISRGVYGAQRVARHLWRMCTALFIASGSFFLGQQKVMPEAIHGSPVLIVLAMAPLVLMIFWLFRVRSAKAFRSPRPPLAART